MPKITLDAALDMVAQKKGFHHDTVITSAGSFSAAGGSIVPTGFVPISVGYSWVPDTPGDKIYVDAMYVTLGSNMSGTVDGPGTLTVTTVALKSVEYVGQEVV